jgi:hypothetical protein
MACTVTTLHFTYVMTLNKGCYPQIHTVFKRDDDGSNVMCVNQALNSYPSEYCAFILQICLY